jgi:hypothetical protein
MALLVGVLVIVMLSLTITALLVALVTAWLARWAELAASLIATRWGYGPALRDGMTGSTNWNDCTQPGPSATGW